MTLPNHWKCIIVENPQMFSVVGDAVAEIVYPNMGSEIDESNVVDEITNCTPAQLILPWHENHWNVYITSVSSTVDVWGRLIGPDYSVNYKLKKKEPILEYVFKCVCVYFCRPS